MRQKMYFILIGLGFLASAQQKGKQTLEQLNESPAGSKIVWFLKSVIEGQEFSEDMIGEYFAPKLIEKVGWEDLSSNINQISTNEGGLHLYEADRKNLTTYALKVKSKNTGDWFKMDFYFEDSAPYRIAGFTIDSIGDQKLNQIIYPK